VTSILVFKDFFLLLLLKVWLLKRWESERQFYIYFGGKNLCTNVNTVVFMMLMTCESENYPMIFFVQNL